MKTILVAEDNAVNLELVTEMLESAGYAVLQAVDGVEVLETLQQRLPDLIILDLQMPRLDGMSTLKRIRESAEWRALPVIACTAFAMVDDRDEALKAGFDGYISKPIAMASLLAAVKFLSGAE